MKKSRAVPISLLSTLAAAALAAGCGSRQGWQTCVDRNSGGTVVDDRYCNDERRFSHPSGYVPHYHWYYYPRGYYSDAPGIGSRVPPGGSYSLTPHVSAPMARSSASSSVVRGGFGSSSRSASS